MSIKEEFKSFILRGNVIDLAVGMVVGASFSNIVKSLVDDVIMPPIGLILGGVDFSNLFITLKDGANPPADGYATLAAAKAGGAVTLNIGLFMNTVVSFLIVATAIFFVVKLINKLKDAALKNAEEAAAEEAPPPTSEEVLLLREIRDALAKKQA
ncbi:large conductance mechanosensitive channel protein MscL [Conchiformibius kuhniae]|uniref:Large-conductance mechanosensitive channel n=1 Tax=Conchiformibius kuhniae TaxID=211502 RepID=A0A8T9MWY8_9NEIS|nr:large conductance mechanosensitive channel protein MscL [Conchiformibius kuhniae]UOP05375.1 large conductance mechanosensitive channel protein MscL [Conchiformibius kuhniae]